MKKEIVYTDKYALILSDEKIKEGDWFFEKAGRLGPFCFSGSKANFHMKKIIAHLPLSDAPILEGVPLLPPFTERVCNCGLKESEHNVRHPFVPQGDDVEELAKFTFPYLSSEDVISEQNKHTDTLRYGFKEGYNKAKEKYKYTEEDLEKVWLLAVENTLLKALNKDVEKNYYQLLESLQQPSRPTHFEFNMEKSFVEGYSEDPTKIYTYKISTTTNSQGQVEFVGKHINQ